MRSIGRPAFLAAALAASLLPGRPSAADTAPADLYVRTPQSVAQAAAAVVRWAKDRKAASVVVAFDVISFAPPPGAHEFRASRYARDLAAWTKALAGLAKADVSVPILLAATGETELAPAADDRAVARFVGALRDTDWTSKRSPVAATFVEWAAKTLAGAPAGRRALVLVGDIHPPENLEEGSLGPSVPETWRRHLARPGTYWDEEQVIAALRRCDTSLAVVAPEARFCDYLPVDDLPQLPWASRPVVTSMPDLPGIDPGEDLHASERGGRFDWATPLFCDRVGNRVVANTDSPSGFGWWPYARVAAATDGVYVRYPTSGPPWLDLCPRDEQLMATMASSLGTRSEWAASRARDPGFGELLSIVAALKDRLPWPQERGQLSGGVWCGFEASASADRRWRERDLPCESFPWTGARSRDWEDDADRAREAAERYAAAADRLARLADRLAARPEARPGRTDANVRLVRFWCEMSAFHLDALALCFERIPKLPPRLRDRQDQVIIAYTSAIKLSDCLAAYDGARITDAEELALADPSDARLRKGAQSNSLIIATDDPRYRARRSFDAVTKHLDPSLLPRARRMVVAAQTVMDRYAKTPYGWVVYYANAATFVHEIQTGAGGLGDHGPLSPPDDRPSTPDSDPDGPRTPK